MRKVRLMVVNVLPAILLAAVLVAVGAPRMQAASALSTNAMPVAPVEQGGLIDMITGTKTATPVATPAATTAGTATPASIEVVIVTPTPAVTTTVAVSPTASGANAAGTVVVANPEGVIEGTVIANRSDATVQFFVEGKTWQLDPQRSAGVELARPTAVLNLYNCDVGDADQSDCFWDPYLLQRDGFYEVVPGAEEGAQVNLVIRAAGAPPTDQIWIQNRSGATEQVYFGTEMRELAPASVTEFAIDPATPSVFYLRTCIQDAQGSTCEWNATEAQPGTFYALTGESWQSGMPGATVTESQLAPVLGAGVAATSAATTVEPVAAAPAETTATTTTTSTQTTAAASSATAQNAVVCTLAVPTLNVRSGPGLAFAVISKIMTTGDTPATVSVIGRTESGEWLQVDERQANGGWVINGDAYMTCPSDTLALAIIPEAALPPTPTPAPVIVASTEGDPSAATTDASNEATTTDAAATQGEATTTTTTPGSAPAGLALLVVQNAFEQPIRFTLDQRYRVAEGPSEVDLAPGQSTSYVVYPGIVAFSASSAWRSLAGNAEIMLNPDQVHTLYPIFVPDPGEEGKWLFQH